MAGKMSLMDALQDGGIQRTMEEMIKQLPLQQQTQIKEALQTPPTHRNAYQQHIVMELVGMAAGVYDIQVSITVSDRSN